MHCKNKEVRTAVQPRSHPATMAFLSGRGANVSTEPCMFHFGFENKEDTKLSLILGDTLLKDLMFTGE